MKLDVLSVALGLTLCAGARACSRDESILPVPSAESAASSGDAGCAPVDWLCCKEEVKPPECKPDGFHACEEGWETCDPGDGGP